MKLTIAVVIIALFLWLYCLLRANERRNKTAGQSLTRYDCIRNKSVDEMAEYIYLHDDELNDKICKSAHKECPYGENVEPEQCIACVKKWLESEVED